jgi:acyl carrier protein
MVTGNAAELTSYDESARLADDLGLNSVGILYLVIAIEESFQIRFEDVGTSDLKTVGQVVDYIQSKVSG